MDAQTDDGSNSTQADDTGALPAVDLEIANTWPAVLFFSILTVGLGIVVLAWPEATLTVLAILLGIQLIALGLYRLITAFSSETSAPFLAGLIGIVGMVAGVVVIKHPFETITLLAVLLGIVWIISGTIDLISAIGDSTLRDRGLVAFGAIVSIVAGIVVVAWPEPTVQVVAWIAGAYLLVIGLIGCFSAFRLRSYAH